jgi:hypothetical protein
MQTPATLRAESRLYERAAAKESEPHLKRCLVAHAFALAQIATKIESENVLSVAKRKNVESTRPHLMARERSR